MNSESASTDVENNLSCKRLLTDLWHYVGLFVIVGHGLTVLLLSFIVGAIAFGDEAVRYARTVAVLSVLASAPAYWIGYPKQQNPAVDFPAWRFLISGLRAGFVCSLILVTVSLIADPDPVLSAFVLVGVSTAYAAYFAYKERQVQKSLLNKS